jgi:hypothetical protein
MGGDLHECGRPAMKSIQHHSRRLLQRMMQAETATSRAEAQKVIRKAEKHQRKLSRLKQMVRDLFSRW